MGVGVDEGRGWEKGARSMGSEVRLRCRDSDRPALLHCFSQDLGSEEAFTGSKRLSGGSEGRKRRWLGLQAPRPP